MTTTFARVSIFCRRMEDSLSFYRDRLGLVVVEQKVIEGAAAGALLQLPPCRIQIALLAPTPDDAVILGLFEIGGVDLDALQSPADRIAYGQSALVLNTRNFDRLHEALQRSGARFLTPPVRYPKRHGSERSPAGLYREMIVFDPDGVPVSVMQIEPLPAG